MQIPRTINAIPMFFLHMQPPECWPADLPWTPSLLTDFTVSEVERTDSGYLVHGLSTQSSSALLQSVYRETHDAGYTIDCHKPAADEATFIIEPITPHSSRIPGTHAILLALTTLSTLAAGTGWYGLELSVPAIVAAVPFTIALLGVLGIHELGHYVVSKHYSVQATPPYFLPVPTIIGTMGAVIRMKGRIPSRKALFDIGIAGPIAGLVATLVVGVIGLHLPPISADGFVSITGRTLDVTLGYPPLLQFLAWVFGQPLHYSAGKMVNPVVVGAWVGLFITFLNLLPVGQLDGGHILHAMVGEQQQTVGTVIPLALFALSGYLFYSLHAPGNAVTLWLMWGVFTAFFSTGGTATPVYETPIGHKRMVLGVVTFAVGVLCFTPVPIVLN